MDKNITYQFTRPESQELPPRFAELKSKLELIGIYGGALEHPQANWNQINLTLGTNNIRKEDLEKLFRDLGYRLIN